MSTSQDSLAVSEMTEEVKTQNHQEKGQEKHEKKKTRGGFKKIVDQARSFIVPRKEHKEEKEEDSSHSESSGFKASDFSNLRVQTCKSPLTTEAKKALMEKETSPRTSSLPKALMKHLPGVNMSLNVSGKLAASPTPKKNNRDSFTSTDAAICITEQTSSATLSDSFGVKSTEDRRESSDVLEETRPSQEEEFENQSNESSASHSSDHSSKSCMELPLPSGGLPILTIDRQVEDLLRASCSTSQLPSFASQNLQRSYDTKKFMQMLQDGYQIHKHGRRGAPHPRTLLVNQDHGKLYWTNPTSRKRNLWRFLRKKFTSSRSYRQLDIDDIHEIRCNLKTKRKLKKSLPSKRRNSGGEQHQQLVKEEDAVFQETPQQLPCSSAPMISLVTNSRSLDIEAENMDHLLYLVHGFHSLVGSKT